MSSPTSHAGGLPVSKSTEKSALTAGIVVIGDEILSGKVRDENCSFLVAELRQLGVALRRVAIIPDVLDEIAETVRIFSSSFDFVFTSGGVGPTHDDLTMEGVARAFDGRVIRHPHLERMLRKHYGDRLEERNLRMADVPDCTELVEGEGLVWPLVVCRNVFILPGVPEIFRRKFLAVRERFRAAPWHLTMVYTRDEEGTIARHLDAVVARFPSVAIGSYPRLMPHETGWRVKVTLESKNGDEVALASAELCELLGSASIVTIERQSPT